MTEKAQANPDINTVIEQYDPTADIQYLSRKYNLDPSLLQNLFKIELKKVKETVIRGEIRVVDFLSILIPKMVEENLRTHFKNGI